MPSAVLAKAEPVLLVQEDCVEVAITLSTVIFALTLAEAVAEHPFTSLTVTV